MITELVFIDLPKGTTRSQALAMYRQTAESWRVNTDLVVLNVTVIGKDGKFVSVRSYEDPPTPE